MNFRPNNIEKREHIDRIRLERENLLRQMQQQSQSTLNRNRPSQPKCISNHKKRRTLSPLNRTHPSQQKQQNQQNLRRTRESYTATTTMFN